MVKTTYIVKRTFRSNTDWLHAWDNEYGTSCFFNIDRAMKFYSLNDAIEACSRANKECRKMPEGMVFSVVEIVL